MKKQELKPPRWADRLLQWFCASDLLEMLQGDLYELYGKNLKERRKFIADLHFIRGVFDLIRPFAIRKFRFRYSQQNIHRHTVLLAFRSYKRHKSSFIINLTGLSTGLACALIIFLWVKDELNINRYNVNDDRLYQVMQNYKDEGVTIRTTQGTAGILARTLAEDFPEIAYATSVVPPSWFSNKGLVVSNDQILKVDGQYVEKDFFQIFDCPLLQGDRENLWDDKYEVIISKELADKLFDNPANVVGKSIEWKMGVRSTIHRISGVFENPPPNALEQYDILINYEIFLDSHDWLKAWGNNDPRTFLLLAQGTKIDEFNTKIKHYLKSKSGEIDNTIFAQLYADTYLYGRYENGRPVGGRIEYVRLFSLIAIFVLIIACINFMNLSTAKASRRMKEIGVKKAMGATRSSLTIQHLEESLLMTVLSTLSALTLVLIILPQFNLLTSKNISIQVTPDMALSLVLIVLVTALVSGSYPALYLSGLRSIDILKGKIAIFGGDILVRKGLVIFQFAMSLILIISVAVIVQQIDFIHSKNLGYNRENILHFDAGIKIQDNDQFFADGGIHEQQMATLMDRIGSLPEIVNVANYEHDLTGNHGGMGGIDWRPGEEDNNMSFNNLQIGYNFIETFEIELIAGRSFSREFSNERNKIIFNEAAIKQMGLQDPVGKTIRVWGQEKTIIGIARDFNMESLFETIRPCIMQLEPRANKIMVKIAAGQEKEAVDAISEIYHERNPGQAFDYRFVDDDYQALYTSEKQVSSISKYFVILAILISFLGLFGLTTITLQKRKKEIGIRKILGSGNWKIIFLLAKDFTNMICISIILSLIPSYFLARNWLDNFAYSIRLPWWIFAGAAFIVLFLAWFTVGIQTIQAARISPTQSLKDE